MLTFIGWLVLLIFLGVLCVVLAAAAVLSPVLPSLTLRASCSVADVKEPGYLVSFPLGYGVLIVYALLAAAFVYLLGKYDADPEAPFGSMHLCGYLAALTLGWVAASLLYRLVLAPSFLKGFWVAGLQLLLGGLAAALAAVLLLIVLSVMQLLQFPMPWSNAPPRPATATAAPTVVSPS